MAEGARLESVFTRKGNVGSNPTLSAISFNGLEYAPAVSPAVQCQAYDFRVGGVGEYKRERLEQKDSIAFRLSFRIFVCNSCGHVEFFKTAR